MLHTLPMIRTDTSNAFAHNTMKIRFPKLIQETLDLNPDYDTLIRHELAQLAREIVADAPIRMISDHSAPDYAYWRSARERYGSTWLGTEWLFAETFCYRLMIEIVNWQETRRDPFAPKKEKEWGGRALWELLDAALAVEGRSQQRLAALIEFALWGNRIDLSYAVSEAHGAFAGAEDLLADDREKVIHHLLNGAGDVHLIADNAGTELAMDLVLTDSLLRDATERVILHLKAHPTYVSDTTLGDVSRFIALLDQQGYPDFAHRLRLALDMGRLQLLPDLNWNSSRLFRELPPRFHDLFRDAKLVIVKGDANYRRLVDDAIWEPETPFAEVTDYFERPLLALRTMKSDPVVGLPAGLAEKLDALDSQWRVNGKRGVIQSNL